MRCWPGSISIPRASSGRERQAPISSDEGISDRIDAESTSRSPMTTVSRRTTWKTPNVESWSGRQAPPRPPTCRLSRQSRRASARPNVPLVPSVRTPVELRSAKAAVDRRPVSPDPERLVQIRVNPLRLLQQDTESNIPKHGTGGRAEENPSNCRRLYARRNGSPSMSRAVRIEETAASILQMLATRLDSSGCKPGSETATPRELSFCFCPIRIDLAAIALGP